MQRDRVVAQRHLLRGFGQPLFPPGHQHVAITTQWRLVERHQRLREGADIHRLCLQPTVLVQLADEVVEVAIVVHRQLALEPQPLQVREQLALGRHRVEQLGMRGLATAGAQQTDRRRATVGDRLHPGRSTPASRC
ncbi:hypothetical protein G6F46_014290 [Rhizopus delemar]|nr:hypothetical protein G6F46_014290 [Rhizopus delemar]